MFEIIEITGAFLWTPIMLFVLLGSGIFLTFRFKFFQFIHAKKIYEETVASLFVKKEKAKATDKNSITPFEAVSAALAGTMGVGNIAGVATAITAGGAGAIFWMWISAFFCMIIKYIEVMLSQLYKVKKDEGYIGGPMYYISQGLKSKKLAGLFAFFCIISSFGIGNMSQANTISESFAKTFGLNKISIGLIVAFVAALIIIGGVKRIVAFTSRMIPAVSVIYIFAALSVIIVNAHNLHESVSLIFSEAFAPQQAGAGFLGFLTSRALRFGIARGIFTHEAGLGSAPIAHAVASPKSPVEQGMWGIFEVFFDTVVVCTLTALTILTTNTYKISGLEGINLTSEAFSSVFGGVSSIFLSFSILFFALLTLVTWNFYGECCVLYIFENNQKLQTTAKNIYKAVFIILIVVGASVDIRIVWNFSDIFNALMALPNMLAVIILSPAAYRETLKHLQSKIMPRP